MISARPQTLFVEDTAGEQASKCTRLSTGIAICCSLLVFGVIAFFILNNLDPFHAESSGLAKEPERHMKTPPSQKIMNFDEALQGFYQKKDFSALREVAKLVPQRTRIIAGVVFAVVLIAISAIVFNFVFLSRREALESIPTDVPKEEPAIIVAEDSGERPSYLQNALISVFSVIGGLALVGALGFFLYKKKIIPFGGDASINLSSSMEQLKPVKDRVEKVQQEIALRKHALFKEYPYVGNRNDWWQPVNIPGPIFMKDEVYNLAELNLAYHATYEDAKDKFIIYKDRSSAVQNETFSFNYKGEEKIKKLQVFHAYKDSFKNMDALHDFNHLLLNMLIILHHIEPDKTTKADTSVKLSNTREQMEPVEELVKKVQEEIAKNKKVLYRADVYGTVRNTNLWWQPDNIPNATFRTDKDYNLAQLNIAYHITYKDDESKDTSKDKFIIYKDRSSAVQDETFSFFNNGEETIKKLQVFHADKDSLKDMGAAFRELLLEILRIVNDTRLAFSSLFK